MALPSRYLGVTIDEVGDLSLASKNPEKPSGICPVLAETDVINMVSCGIARNDILKGIHLTMADRLIRLLRSADIQEKVVITGGPSKDEGLRAAVIEGIAKDRRRLRGRHPPRRHLRRRHRRRPVGRRAPPHARTPQGGARPSERSRSGVKSTTRAVRKSSATQRWLDRRSAMLSEVPTHTHLRLCLALSLLSVGCYQSHGVGDADGGVRPAVDASPADTGSADTGSPPLRDAGEQPLPPEPEVDLGPDARPSDYPEAEGWRDPDPSAYPPDEPCCTLIGEEQTIEMGGDEGVGTVALEWNGREWGLLYVGFDRGIFVPLRPLGEPGMHRRLPAPGGVFGDIAWGAGRFGVAVGTAASDNTATFMLVDERGTLASELTTIPDVYGATMARMTHLDRWAVAATGSTASGGTQLALHELDGAGRVLGDPAHFEPVRGYSAPPALAGLKSRMVVFHIGWSRLPGIVATTFTSPYAASPADEHEIFEMGSGFLQATHFRNNALVSVSGGDADLRLAAFEPFDGIVTAHHTLSPFPVALSADHATGLGASDGKGLIGVCAVTGGPGGVPGPATDPPTVIQFFLFGPDLDPLGLPIDVGQMNDAAVAGCEVGFSDDNVLVAWWDHAVPVIHVRAVRP